MNSIDKLSEIFSRFPGIGPRQAKRFVYFLLSRNGDYVSSLVKAVSDLKKEIIQCKECMRYYAKNGSDSKVCSICSDKSRDSSMLMIVPGDIDLEVVEKSESFHGLYFVLGGVVPILVKEPEKRIRIKDLGLRIKEGLRNGLKEIILAMNANLDGENTAEFIKQKYQGEPLIFSTLGRGLSTGAELEYADPETLKNAFLHRTK
mgnify:CR=1 FL=1